MPADGEIFIAATGGAVAAGQPIDADASAACRITARRRAASRWRWRWSIALAGAWAASRPAEAAAAKAAERKRLIARREKLFNDLVRLEHDRRTGRVDDRRYATRREELVAALEQIYGALDDDDIGPEPAGARDRAVARGRDDPRRLRLRPARRRLAPFRPPPRAVAASRSRSPPATSSACSARTAPASRR